MENFIVKAIEIPEDLIEEGYFDTVTECVKWCEVQRLQTMVAGYTVDNIIFEIHSSVGATTYMRGRASSTKGTEWEEVKYTEFNMPNVRPWWTISEIPVEALNDNLALLDVVADVEIVQANINDLLES